MFRNRHSGWMLGFAGGALLASAATVINLAAAVEGTPTAAQFAGPLGAVSFADVVEEVSPAVVNIAITKSMAVMPAAGLPGPNFGPGPGDRQYDEFFGRFFDMPSVPRAPQEVQGVGSGFLVDADGYVVTNHHVIDGATTITVTLQDGRKFDGTLVGQDPKTDLALLKIEDSASLPSVELGDSDQIRVGDWVLAIGNPFGLGGTATAGIVSARGRDIQSGPYDDYLQIDAPINSGNSGGPVFNTVGEVIGVNTAIYSPSGGNVGIGFAVPANQVLAVISELRSSGTVNRGWLGVQIQALDDDLAASLGLETADGALIAEVVAGSPADNAGLRAGDVITGLDSHPIDSSRTLSRLVGDGDPDERIRLKVWRDGAERTIDVTLGGLEPATVNMLEPEATGTTTAEMGLVLRQLDAESRSRLGLPEDIQGVLVAGVDTNSPAAKKGVRSGDVLLQVNGKAVKSTEEAVTAIETAKSASGRAMLLLRRGENQRFVSVALA